MRPARQLKAVDFDQNRHTLRYRISPIRTQDDLRASIKDLIGDRAFVLKPRPDRRFFTFGSCFAENVAEALIRKGGSVYTSRVTEDINSPYNNLMLLRRVFFGTQSAAADELQANTGVDFTELRKELAKATDVIFTLGNIFRLECEGVHTVISTKYCQMVIETFNETVECLREILKILVEHTNARIFVSVSPIPISGYFGDDFKTAVEADCASKCQLVAAIRTLSGFTYIPTFEIFRWLPAHQDFPTFGAGRDNPRHLWGAHVGIVMEALCGKKIESA